MDIKERIKHNKELLKEILIKEKKNIFVNHVQSHLNDSEIVICKICNKTIDDVFDEYLNKALNDFDSALKEVKKDYLKQSKGSLQVKE